jgi:dsDNA-specific endonuclease/ATPase MutS2
MFKLGDKVKVIDDNQKGKVIKVQKNLVTILNEFGFEESFFAHELLPDLSLEIGKVIIQEPASLPKKSGVKPLSEPKEVDLHIGQLVDSFAHLSNYEMLQIQLDKVRVEMDLARAEKRSRLIFIHGHGTGKLKKELLKLLSQYTKIEVYDASYRKYNGGATEVSLR